MISYENDRLRKTVSNAPFVLRPPAYETGETTTSPFRGAECRNRTYVTGLQIQRNTTIRIQHGARPRI
jgi:hypothetical protein